MNILIALSQRSVTGAEVYGVTVADELIKRGHNVVIVSDTLTKKTNAKFIPIPFNQRSLVDRIKHVKCLLKIIKEYDIQIVHANSRASSWSCALACFFANIPLITSTHGRQPVHLSRKLIKGFGRKSICVCENIQTQIVNELGYPKEKTILLRNPVDATLFKYRNKKEANLNKIIVSLIGRLGGPKGDVAYDVIKHLSVEKNIFINVIGGETIPERFKEFANKENVNFVGFVNNVQDYIADSDVVIGAGRVSVEAILSGRPTIAVGEAIYEGLVTKQSLNKAISSNFGDINVTKETVFDYSQLKEDVLNALKLSDAELLYLKNIVSSEFSLTNIIDSIEKIYSKEYVEFKQYEMPIIMYHRIIENDSEIGVHGTYVTKEKFRAQLQYLKDNGYQTVTFKDLKDNNYKKRFNKGNKFIVLTFDDGYEDNYQVAFPILKEFGFKAVIFLLSDSTYNKWDTDNPQKPEKTFPLMTDEMIQEMMQYGIEFGIHTKTHPRLNQIPLHEARNEILESKKTLEERFKYKFITFAYPYGNLNEKVKAIVKESGVEFAVATDSGDIPFDSDLMQIRRIALFPGNSLFTFKRKVSGKYNFIKVKREQKH